MKTQTFLFLSIFLFSFWSFAAPKYGPYAVPLSEKSNQEYFQKNSAPDFWALIPYYLPQETNRGCSAANMAMILNAARAGKKLSASEELVTYKSFIEKYSNDTYRNTIEGKTATTGTTFANTNLRKILQAAAEKLKISQTHSQIEFVEVDSKSPDKGLQKFLEALKQNEKSANDFIFFSFVQGKVTGDPEGGAHVATVAGYDEKKKLVLVLDPDRQWYEPYWTPAEKLFEAISDPKSDSEQKTGWIYFKVK